MRAAWPEATVTAVAEHRPAAERWRAELRHRLITARKERDAASTSALRSTMSAIDNAETPDGPVPAAGAIADSAVGVGAAEVPRRELRDDEVRRLIHGEIDERRTAADQFTLAGHHDRAAVLHAEADVLARLLDEV
ncbi:GatB/YqeY domain-containing protein [Mycolicibacterium vaccae]|jgi:uncharacterized protein YqeY|uniref:GatB/YqeY n=1 Tax=Mycolicibacterium vaccae ATCC 25954 TaxID=1194972 RepID=K0V5X5_MYCVA|nr:GatB/YqeY [Mycolicibacterium vaccae ATCC 25954]MCV7062086.1 GatB/YqeY domain-containing protein [Mycolicibacterium vaccae]